MIVETVSLFLAGALIPACAESADRAARSLIVHADDAGMCHSVNRATIEAMDHGIVTSASILVPCPWFLEFADYARRHPEKDFGVHLTLTSEWATYRWGPVASRDKVASLLDDEGYLYRESAPAAAHARLHEAETELRAQIDRAKKFGIRLSHIDTHMGTLFARADLLELYVNLGISYNLPIMFSRQGEGSRLETLYPAIRGHARQAIEALERHHLPVLDAVTMFYVPSAHAFRKSRYLDALHAIGPGVTELIIHCGIDNDELGAITSSAAMRDSDRRFALDPEVKSDLERSGIKLTTWTAFHAAADRNH
jgi:hypothetical protein